MADEKKPRIDLKARLGKTQAAPAPTPAPAPVVPQVTPSGRPMPMPEAPPSRPPQAFMPPTPPTSLPIPTPMPPAPRGLPIPGPAGFAPGPTGFDPNNPLGAAVAPQYQQSGRAPAVSHEPQRIEIDELTIQQASKSSLRKGLLMGCVLALAVGGVGYVAGGAQEQAAGRAKAKEGAVDLATNAGKAKDQLKTLADKMEQARKDLSERKFPATLSRELGAINVDFDGKQLEGRRFSGFSTDTTRALVEFITAVQGVNDRKLLIQGLLSRLEKPITEGFKVPEGQYKISYVVAFDKDPANNMAGFLSRLAEPITATGAAIALPADFTFANPGGPGNTKLPVYKSGDISTKPAAVYVVPKTFDAVCPSAVGGQTVQLAAALGSFLNEVRGEQAGAGPQDTVTDSKPGLLERADKLIKALGTVGT